MKKKFLLMGIGIFLCVNCGIDTVTNGMINKLNKAFHYSGKNDVQVVNIDIGRIVLLFSSQSKAVNYVLKRTKSSDYIKDMYLFPFATMGGAECQKLVKNFNKAFHGDYTFNLRCITGKVPGLELKISYNPKKVSVEPRLFDTINSSRGFEFRFYNKGLIQQIGDRLSNSMRVSSLKKKRLLLTVGMEALIPVQQDYLV